LFVYLSKSSIKSEIMSPSQQATQQPETQQEMTPIPLQASGVVAGQPVKFPNLVESMQIF
jgi:hypothetical protein